jgi:hypothetical protein
MLEKYSIQHFTRAARAVNAFALLALLCGTMLASSHSDAPLIKQDPQANLTDVYAFVGTQYNNPSIQTLNIIVSVHPFSEPGDGVMYERFADDAIFSIHLADPNTGRVITTYNFRYSPVSASQGGIYKNTDTILSYGRGTTIGPIMNVNDSAQNFTQTYSVTKFGPDVWNAVIGENLLVPPPNVGKNTTPLYNNSAGIAVSGATSFAGLDHYTAQTVYTLPTGESVWSGSREDSFFADAPGIFDLLEARILGADGHGQNGNGVDGFKGYNVLTYAMQIPLSMISNITYQDAFTGTSHGIGVYASVSRPSVTLRAAPGAPIDTRVNFINGLFVQVDRLGNPLFNEVLVALQDKDNYNFDSPTDDRKYETYALNPEIATLINAVFGTSFVTSGRTDLAAVFIPDVLRVDLTTGPVPLIGAGGNRLSGLGGDLTNGKWSGWPNGRRLGDDVVDIALTAVASGPSYSSIFLLGDNINMNDAVYNFVFPYAATPWAGPTNRKDPTP